MDLIPVVKIVLIVLGIISTVWWLWSEIRNAPLLENDEELWEGKSK